MVLGALLAVFAWWSPVFRGVVTPGLLLVQSFPVVALVPVLTALLGYDVKTVYAITVVVSLFPAFAFTRAGMELPTQAMRDVFTVTGTPRRRLLIHMVMPAAVSRILLALRLSATSCILSALLAEFLMGTRGLGHIIGLAQSTQQLPEAYAAALIGSAMSLLSFVVARAVLQRAEIRFLIHP
jgi:NitT/TauT family transport system permease protein